MSSLILIYAVLSLYLMSPPVKKYIFHCRSRPSRPADARQSTCIDLRSDHSRGSRYRAGCARSAVCGNRMRAASKAVLVDAMKPSSSDAFVMPV